MRVSLLGFVAGLLALLVWVLVIYLALAIFALAFTLVDELATGAEGMALEGQLGSLLGQSIVASGGNALPAYRICRAPSSSSAYWASSRPGAINLGLGGACAGWWMSFLGVAALLVVAVITWVFVQREQITLWMAESPETYRWRDIMLDSHFAALSVGPIFALAIAYPAWLAWQWWFVRLADRVLTRSREHCFDGRGAGRCGGPSHLFQTLGRSQTRRADRGQYSDPAAEPHRRAYAEEWRRIATEPGPGLSALLLIGAIGGAITAIASMSRSPSDFSTARPSWTQPRSRTWNFALRIDPDVQRLRIVNINGLGAIAISLRSPGNSTEQVAETPEWAFEWRADEYLYQDIPVQGLAPGDYILAFEQRAGWGYFEYMLSQGGGRNSQILAIATGLLLAITIALAVILAALVVARLTDRIL